LTNNKLGKHLRKFYDVCLVFVHIFLFPLTKPAMWFIISTEIGESVNAMKMKIGEIFAIGIMALTMFAFSACGNRHTVETNNVTEPIYIAAVEITPPIQEVAVAIEPVILMQEAQAAKINLFKNIEKIHPYCTPTEECEEKYGHVPPPRYLIALTFDDGPSRFTEYILAVLEKHGARATFCVIGNRVESRAEIVQRTVAGGSEVIGHSWNHANLALQNEYTIRNQLRNTSDAIEAAIGSPPPPIFRAPYGSVNARVRSISYDMGYAILNWTIDTQDWRIRDAQHIYNHIMQHARHGSIVLLHDIFESTAVAMELVVPALIQSGFELVTASELIEYIYGTMEPGIEYRGLRPGERGRKE